MDIQYILIWESLAWLVVLVGDPIFEIVLNNNHHHYLFYVLNIPGSDINI